MLKGQSEAKIRHGTVIGGLGGLGIALKLVVIGISAKIGLNAMTEGKAIVLYLICMCLAGGAMGVVTVLTEPSGEVFALAVTLIAILGGIAASEVASRTMPSEGDHD